MATVLFVHGTGVRRASYDASYAIIEKRLREAAPTWRLAPCYWGDACGSSLHRGGKSIPGYAQMRDADAVDAESEAVVLWSLLYEDPLFELRAWPRPTEDGEAAPNAARPTDALATQLTNVALSAELARLVNEAGLNDVWSDAVGEIVGSAPFDASFDLVIATDPSDDIERERREATARAIVAQAIQLAGDDSPVPDGTLRDAIVARLLVQLGQRAERGVLDALVVAPIKGLALRYATRRGRKDRGVVSDAAAPVVGDILLYQARGDAFRAFIRQCVEDLGESHVVLLAHSLGGIACVDLLAMANPPAVKALITVGSQSPLFYELDCLASRRANEALPDEFPRWLNLYDPNDFLSYLGEGVFLGPPRVTDKKVESRQPFPQSHSAYWTNATLWKEIGAFLQTV